MILNASMVDSFQLKSKEVGKSPTCAFKFCTNTGRVRVFFHAPNSKNQERSNICVNHALDLANEILSVYKFGR